MSNLPGADYYRAGWRNVVTWRSLRYLHPYVAILIGAVRQPVGYEGDPNFGSEVAYGVNLGLHVGVAAEVGRFQAAVEYGGSAVGDGSEELRACVTCAIRPLPAPRVLPPYVARVSVQYFSRLVGAWGFGEWEWPGWDASVWFPSAGHASRGYEFGIFFTQERRPGQGLAFHTGVFYLGTDWRFRAADRPLLRPFSLSAGGRLLVWTEGEMVPVLPAPTVGLDADFQMGRIVISGGVKALATYSPAHGFISGWTGRAGVGVLF